MWDIGHYRVFRGRGLLHEQNGRSTKNIYFSTVKEGFHYCLAALMSKVGATNFLTQFWASGLCQDTVAPDVHWQQWDSSQGLAKEEQISVNFPANSFYALSLICKGINFSAFLPENRESLCFSSAHHLQLILPDDDRLWHLSLSRDLSLGSLVALSSVQIVQQRQRHQQK